ncbi:hypothetical protein CFIMG_008118RA00001 [Ceratocystis fimbriata CBS 114723]|uniref:Uncharacterized protein n=1 Tax=Ceratocystis fimbriata CBS 114723 TaxID=1035309 RepID=A0A2C5VWX6_9PEZI|nr:hypothetical protein CFIMG_008118RA00001 [Ceratocystis fimbriata CBS 114723]
MGFPASRRPASYARRTLHHLVNDDTLSGTIPLDFHEALLVCCRYNCWIKPKLLVIHPEKAEDRIHKPQPICIEVKLLRCDAPEPVKRPYPHERSADGKAQDEAASILSSEHFPRVPPKIKP